MDGPSKGRRAVFVVRHGEKERSDGLDPPLTPLGVQQAEATGKSLKDRRIALMVVSPFKRTLQTAVHITKNLKPDRIVLDWGIGEWLESANWGEGPCPALEYLEANLAERQALIAELKVSTYTQYSAQPCPAESRAELLARTEAALNHLNAQLPDGGGMLVVTHAATHEAIVRTLSTGYKAFFPDPCSLSIVTRNSDAAPWSVDLVASTAHLSYLAKQQPPVHRGPHNNRR